MQFVNGHEIKPIIYGKFPVKILPDYGFRPNELAFPFHWHNRFELLIIKQGCLNYYYSNEHIVFNEGDIAIISPKILGAHTINEMVDIESVKKCDMWLWETLNFSN